MDRNGSRKSCDKPRHHLSASAASIQAQSEPLPEGKVISSEDDLFDDLHLSSGYRIITLSIFSEKPDYILPGSELQIKILVLFRRVIP